MILHTCPDNNNGKLLYQRHQHLVWALCKNRGGGGTKSVEHIRSKYPRCVGVQAKNEEVSQDFWGQIYRKIIILPEDDKEASNKTKMT